MVMVEKRREHNGTLRLVQVETVDAVHTPGGVHVANVTEVGWEVWCETCGDQLAAGLTDLDAHTYTPADHTCTPEPTAGDETIYRGNRIKAMPVDAGQRVWRAWLYDTRGYWVPVAGHAESIGEALARAEIEIDRWTV